MTRPDDTTPQAPVPPEPEAAEPEPSGTRDPLLRGDLAPAPRTLVDILRASVAAHPDDPAVDNGQDVLTYAEFAQAAEQFADALHELGIGSGERIGIRIPSGTLDLYVAIAGTLVAGCAYVPVDFDDPDERADTVFGEADVAAIVGKDLVISPRAPHADDAAAHDDVRTGDPALTDDAWIIFTSGSTGKPKGVAVTHRNAAAFVDAEANLFLQNAPIGPGDRVMAGLSVAFDASCEEMWLAWRYGACLVPAPRSLVKSGMDLGPWLTANDITIISTVPTLVALWPHEAIKDVRLVILGGEACPPEIGARLATEAREVWNTYGPTEATVVACAAQLTGEPPVRIGLPLDGWDLAVVDSEGNPVPQGEAGELIIGGVGLARYLDPAKDAEKYAPMPTLGWERAYRSGDIVVNDPIGLTFQGRADDQIKLNGRRIELGEVDSALLQLPHVSGAAAAVRTSETGNKLLVGYLTVKDGFDRKAATAYLRETMPAALVPQLAVVDTLPTRTSGKIDRDALPWPLEIPTGDGDGETFTGTAARLQELFASILGTPPTSPDDNFFDLGGGSLTAAQLVARLRETNPEITVADVYEANSITELAATIDQMSSPTGRLNDNVVKVRRSTQTLQVVASLAVRQFSALRWLTWLGAGANLAHASGMTWVPTLSWWWILVGWVLFVAPPGRMLLAAGFARTILAGVTPGAYSRGGRTHLRVWLAERIADELGATNLAGAPLVKFYGRLLGCDIKKHVDLHSLPPVTGFLTLGKGCSIEPEVELRGHWIDGDTFHLGRIEVGPNARVGTRSTLLPGARVGKRAEIAPGSGVFGRVPADQLWSGAPAEHIGAARGPWDEQAPPNKPIWLVAYGATGMAASLIPAVGSAAGLAVLWPWLRHADSVADIARIGAIGVIPATLVGFVVTALVIFGAVRALGRGLVAGHHPIHGGQGWRAWTTMRILDEARTWLFPLYSSTLTPNWLRALGAKIGREVEASTVLMLPKMADVGEGAFLADDTLVANYELGGGWIRIAPVKVGKGAFIGNSGMAAPGRKVPKRGLVAVLSAAPARGAAKKGTSWLGSPPQRLRRQAGETDASRTTAPPTKLRVARAVVEALRIIPQSLHSTLIAGAALTMLWVADTHSWWLAALTAGFVLVGFGALGGASAVIAKWLLVGRLRVTEYPLWSSFVWRNELADTFTEVVAAPWLIRANGGTPVLNLWLRAMGAKIGHGVWCETYWLPEADLIRLGDGACVNSGCVVQTHLFHDRILAMDTVTLGAGATLGPNSVVLPAAKIGTHATVGPTSLVMRGESVPDKTRWLGNPIGPWIEDENPADARRDGGEMETDDAVAHDDEAARTSQGATHVEFHDEPSSPVASDEHPGDGQPVTNGASFEGRDATPTARPESDS